MAVPFATSSPDPEVPEKAQRRKFSAEDKKRILEDVDRATGHGGIGAVLRREGIYSSTLHAWRKERDRAVHKAFSQKRGPQTRRNPLVAVREADDKTPSAVREVECVETGSLPIVPLGRVYTAATSNEIRSSTPHGWLTHAARSCEADRAPRSVALRTGCFARGKVRGSSCPFEKLPSRGPPPFRSR